MKDKVKKASKIGLALVIGGSGAPLATQYVHAEDIVEQQESEFENGELFLVQLKDEKTLKKYLDETKPFLVKADGKEVETKISVADEETNTYSVDIVNFDESKTYMLYFHEDESENHLTNRAYLLDRSNPALSISLESSKEDVKVEFQEDTKQLVLTLAEGIRQEDVLSVDVQMNDVSWTLAYEKEKGGYVFEPKLNGSYELEVCFQNKSSLSVAYEVTGLYEEALSYDVDWSLKGGEYLGKDSKISLTLDERQIKADTIKLSFISEDEKSTSLKADIKKQAPYRLTAEIALADMELADGSYHILLEAKDLKGEAVLEKSPVFTLDTAAPVISMDSEEDIYLNESVEEETVLAFQIQDENLEAVETEILFDGKVLPKEQWESKGITETEISMLKDTQLKRYTFQKYGKEADGDYQVRVKASDKAGNTAENTRNVFINNLAPVVSFKKKEDIYLKETEGQHTEVLQIFGKHLKDEKAEISVYKNGSETAMSAEQLLQDGIFIEDGIQTKKQESWQKEIRFTKLSEEAAYRIAAKSTDKNGNISSVAEKKVIVDHSAAELSGKITAPSSTAQHPYYNQEAVLTLSVKEAYFDEILAKVRVNGKEVKDLNWTKGSAADTYTAELRFAKDAYPQGTYQIALAYTDQAGNVSKQYETEICYDEEVDLRVSSSITKEGWQNTQTTYTYVMRDDTSKLSHAVLTFDQRSYTVKLEDGRLFVDGKACEDHVYATDAFRLQAEESAADEWTIKLTVLGNYNGDIQFLVKDHASNEKKAVQKLQQSLEKPQFADEEGFIEAYTMKDAKWTNKPYLMEIEVKEMFAPVDRVEYSFDKETWYPAEKKEGNLYAFSADIEENTVYKGAFYVRAINVADSISDPVCIWLQLDKLAPKVTIEDHGSAQNDIYYQKDVEHTIRIQEDSFDEGQTYITFTKNGKLLKEEDLAKEGIHVDDEWKQEKTTYTKQVRFDVTKEGVYSYEVSSSDMAGNTVLKNWDAFVMDHTDPSASFHFRQQPNKKFEQEDNYFDEDAVTLTMKVKETNFRADDMHIEVKKDGKAFDAYAMGEWNSRQDEHSVDLTFQQEGHYTVRLSGKDLAGRQLAPVEETFVIDHTLPVLDGKKDITFHKTKASKAMKLLRAITFGEFFQEEVEVRLHAEDEISGIDQIYFYYDGIDHKGETQSIPYNKEEFSTDHLERLEGAVVSRDGNEMNVRFKLKPNFKGSIYAVAQDKAGNIKLLDGKKVYSSSAYGIVVEDMQDLADKIDADMVFDIEPQNTLKDGTMLFREDVPLHFDIRAPYSGIKSVTYQLGDSKPITVDSFPPGKDGICERVSLPVTVTAQQGGINENNHVVLALKVTDNAGNSRSFTKTIAIDKTAPQLSYEFDNNTAYNERYYNRNRTLRLHIRELNFDPQKVSIAVYENGVISAKTPKPSAWRSSGIDHSATILFDNDADYSVKVSYHDEANNKGNDIRIAEFTIDKTRPQVAVSYDNNSSRNSSYFKAGRTATLRVEEHNFDPSSFQAIFSAEDDGKAVARPVIGRWATHGDTHTAMVSFDKDAAYSMELSYKDKANNQMNEVPRASFTIDLKNPEVSITNVKNLSSNRRPVAPTISFADTNLDIQASQVSVEGNKNGNVRMEAAAKDQKNGKIYTMQPLKLDDNYVVSADIQDLAGNATRESVSFSVNQNGSTFIFQQKLVNKKYINKAFRPSIMIENVDEVTVMSLTLNGVSVPYTLENGLLTIDKLIEQDGKYIINMEVRDAAGNVSSMPPIEFIYDAKAPEPVILINGEDAEAVYFGPVTVTMKCAVDGDEVTAVYVNGRKLDKEQYTIEDGAAVLRLDAYDSYEVQFEMKDAAGNTAMSKVYAFTITNNLLLCYYYNKPLFYGSIAAAGAVLLAFVYWKKRKEKNEQESIAAKK